MQIMLNKPMRYEFRNILHTAKRTGLLPKKTLQSIDSQHYALTNALFSQYNNNRSTCASQRLIQKLIKSIDYTIDHGLLYYEHTLPALQHVPISKLYEQGRVEIEQRIHTIHTLQEELISHPLPFFNERYLSIFNQQLPAFLIPYEKTQKYYNAYQCLEDFDYPLLDGLALINNNYNLKGIDFVLEYMERLWLEQSFCLHFSTSDIAAFIERYEIQKDVKVDMLGVNVCEILLTQHLFSMLLASSSRLLLTQHECSYIEHMLQNIHIDDTFVTSIFTKALDNFPASIQLYLQTYAESFKELLQVMVPQQSISEWMIVPQEKLTTDVQLTPPCDPKVFQKLLSDIYNTETIDGKMELIIQTPLGLYDYLDLLNDSIFIEEELPVFFAKLDIFQIALLFYVQNQELFRFHQIPTLSEEELLNLDIHELWEPSFYKYINNLSAKQKKALHDAFQAIKTIDLSS